ncbi:hypothetical protein ODJ79_45370 [Actinoplanes sp. KI2]|uniref:hypothetical protein n=1 Tax=Actinoplanes sp. KI2 TaxID=2983315 RepID=UPI0021D59E59|nr:hypothetical protein [Actinoplanes sp. KI2]MCU7730990.1 hypothetical protein [Actinoplanes sp. KI2]
MGVRAMSVEAVVAAAGRGHRDDEIRPGTGGPAGNAALTAWTGLVLLALFLAELVTLLDVRGLLSWHVVVGTLLIPPALVKTGSTGWRMIGYYLDRRPYRRAGPPPMLLRLLGPLVVASTLAVLGTGVTLVLVGPVTGRRSLVDVAGQHVDLLTLHKVSFVAWAGATGLHVLGRLIPAMRLTVLRPETAGPIPGRVARAMLIAATAAVAVITAVLVLGLAGPWRAEPRHFHRRPVAEVGYPAGTLPTVPRASSPGPVLSR